MRDTTGDRSLTGRRGEDHRLGLCYTMLPGGLQSTLFYMLQDEAARSVVFERTSYPPLSRLSAVQSTYNSLIPVDTNAYICSVAPCLRVLWMSTHGCFLPLFPLSLLPGCRNQMPEPRSQTPQSATTPTTPEVPTTTCSPLTTTRSS